MGNLAGKKKAPYDRIWVCAAPVTIPDILIGQLAPKGYMVIPGFGFIKGSINPNHYQR
ncbi:MAG: hypothetical protein CM1200mP10_20750 [Candidatus Neomarinimicrobiota bacterium]|nr:MAG: hypothetical protein CM1200mP10_20750 [Candidatus Neomarinimicrobiota bacterium]